MEVSATSSAAAAMELSDLGVTTVDTKKHEKKIIEEKIRTLNKEEERGSGNARVNAPKHASTPPSTLARRPGP